MQTDAKDYIREQDLIEQALEVLRCQCRRKADVYSYLLLELGKLPERCAQELESSLDVERIIGELSAQQVGELAEDLYAVLDVAKEAGEAGFKAFSVILASWLENDLRRLLRLWGANLPADSKWHCIEHMFDILCGHDLASLQGWEKVSDVRHFANLFKHRYGVATRGKPVDYTKPNWGELILAVERFLVSVAESLANALGSPKARHHIIPPDDADALSAARETQERLEKQGNM